MPAVSERVPADEHLQKARFALRIQELCRDDEEEEGGSQVEEPGALPSSKTWASSRAAALGSSADKDKALLRSDSAEKIAAEMDAVLLQLRHWQQQNKSDLDARLARNLQLLEEAYAPPADSGQEVPGSVPLGREGVDTTQQSAAETSSAACTADLGSAATTGGACVGSRRSSSARASGSSSSSRSGGTSAFALSRRLPSQHASGQAATQSAVAAPTAAPPTANASNVGSSIGGSIWGSPLPYRTAIPSEPTPLQNCNILAAHSLTELQYPRNPPPGQPSSRPASGQAWSRAALEGSSTRMPAVALSRPSTSSTLPPTTPSAACSSSASLSRPSSGSSSNGHTDGLAARVVRPQLLPSLSGRPSPSLAQLHPGGDGSLSLHSLREGGNPMWGSSMVLPLSSQPQQLQQHQHQPQQHHQHQQQPEQQQQQQPQQHHEQQQHAAHPSPNTHAQQHNDTSESDGAQSFTAAGLQHSAQDATLGTGRAMHTSPPDVGDSSVAEPGERGRGQELLDELEAELRELDAEEKKPGGITEWHSDVARLLAQMDLLQTGYQVGDRDGPDTLPVAGRDG